MDWLNLANAIYMEALFTSCCHHDWICFIGNGEFAIEDYKGARESFANRNR